jgi:hypothetical protein
VKTAKVKEEAAVEGVQGAEKVKKGAERTKNGAEAAGRALLGEGTGPKKERVEGGSRQQSNSRGSAPREASASRVRYILQDCS